MEFLTILLSGLLGLLSPAGIALDSITAQLIRDQLFTVEDLRVRIDNAPSYQILAGRVERVRVAGRGVFPEAGVRIAELEVETEAIAVSPNQLRAGRVSLDRPLNAGIRLVLTQADLNQALQSHLVRERLRPLRLNLLGGRYRPINPQITLLEGDRNTSGDRLRLQVILRPVGQPNDPGTPIALETGIGVAAGRKIQLVNPIVILGDQQFSLDLILQQSDSLRQLFDAVNQQLDLQNFEPSGIVSRLLELKIEDGEIHVAAFVQIKPEAF